jgi:hypothetical protein
MRNSDTEDSRNAIQRPHPGVSVGEIPADYLDTELLKWFSTLRGANKRAGFSTGGC